MIYYQQKANIITKAEDFGAKEFRIGDIVVFSSSYSYVSNGTHWNGIKKIKSNKLNLKLYKNKIIDYDDKYIFYK